VATDTGVDVVMPQMGVSVSEGTITKWLKREGEHVEADEPLLEISTDKVDTEVPSPASGTVTRILVQEGTTVDVGTPLALIGDSLAAPADEPTAPPEPEQAAAEQPAEPEPPLPPVSPPASAEPVQEAVAPPPPSPAPPEPELPPVSPAPAEPTAAPESVNGKTFVSPVVARIASEHGVDPQTVPGTGRGGRVTKRDILDFIESGERALAAVPETPAPSPTLPPVSVTPPPASTAAPTPRVPQAAPPSSPAAPPAPSPAPAPVAAGGETLEPMSAMRRGIAEHMRRSLDTSAHVTSAIEVDMSKVVGIRAKLKSEYQSTYGVNPTYLAFIARAAVTTLGEYPYVNGEIRGDMIVTRGYVNLGIAVELADGKGLIVPVVRNAEGLNLLGMARAIADVAARARSKQLTPDDVAGGTFTITNPGGYGTFHGTPVISQPQAAILGTYALVKRPWVVTDELGEDVIAIRPIMNLTLTYDHRLVDGALAGRFLRDLHERLQTWGETDY